jgi:hypothetical protein
LQRGSRSASKRIPRPGNRKPHCSKAGPTGLLQQASTSGPAQRFLESSKGDSSRSGSPARAAAAFEVSDLNAQPNKLRTGIAEASNPPPLCDTCDTLPPYRPFARVTPISQNRCHKCHTQPCDGDPLPRPSLKVLDFFNSVRGHPRFNPRCGRERAMYTRVCQRAGTRSRPFAHAWLVDQRLANTPRTGTRSPIQTCKSDIV